MLSIQWNNNSYKYEWTLGQTMTAPPPWGHMANLPKSHLAKGEHDMTGAQMDIAGQDLIDAANMFFVWYAEVVAAPTPSVYWFATAAIQPVNVFHGGPSNYWEICAGQVTSPDQIPNLTDTAYGSGINPFRQAVSDPAQPYDFTAAADSLPANLSISVAAIVGGEDLQVVVKMSDAKVQ